eukprot:PhF_6_TR2184/c0_g1_i7/m.3601/K07359/CAMKK2; calcium/calmodulin-dependent protein kinase kinase 2
MGCCASTTVGPTQKHPTHHFVLNPLFSPDGGPTKASERPLLNPNHVRGNDSSSNNTLPLDGAERSASALLSSSEVFFCTDEINSLKEQHPISPVLVKSPHLFHMYDPANDAFERSTLQEPKDNSSGADSTHELVRGVDMDGNKLLNEYVVVAPIGEGSYGKVKLCVDTTNGSTVAIKILNKLRMEKRSRLANGITPIQQIYQEVNIMKACRHPNLVKLNNVIKDPNVSKLYLVMEYLEGGPLGHTPSLTRADVETGPRVLDIPRIRSNILDVLFGLQFLHDKGVIHMDIKPENILVSKDGECKLADFGVCAVLGESFEINSRRDDLVYRIQGTPPYFAPEMLLAAKGGCGDTNDAAGGFHGKATDVWALGVTLYTLVYGCLPFGGSTMGQYHDNVLQQSNNNMFATATGEAVPLPDSLLDVMKRMLEKDSFRRVRVKDLVGHPFFATSVERVPLTWWVQFRREEEERERKMI